MMIIRMTSLRMTTRWNNKIIDQTIAFLPFFLSYKSMCSYRYIIHYFRLQRQRVRERYFLLYEECIFFFVKDLGPRHKYNFIIENNNNNTHSLFGSFSISLNIIYETQPSSSTTTTGLKLTWNCILRAFENLCFRSILMYCSDVVVYFLF